MGSKYRTFSRSFFTLTFIHSLTGNVVFLLPSNYRPRLRGLGRPKLHSSFPVLALLPYNFYCSPTKLRGGNAFSGVCLFRMGGGLVQGPSPSCTGPWSWTGSNLLYLDLTVQGSTPDMFKLVQLGPLCRGTPHWTYTNLFTMNFGL